MTAPKPQKTRVAELEAQVAELTRLLEAQKFPSPTEQSPSEQSTQSLQGYTPPQQANVGPSTDASYTQTGPTKKRRLDVVSNGVDPDPSTDMSTALDAIIPRSTQARILDHYVTNMLPIAPLVPLIGNEINVETLHKTKPMLLQAIMFVASTDNVSEDQQEAVAKVALSNFASKAIADGADTIDVLQAIEVGTLWYRTSRMHRHMAVFQLITLAAEIAEEIGLAGSPSLRDARVGEDFNTISATRVWLTCRLLSASVSLFNRQPKAPGWSEHDDRGLFILEYSSDALESDRLLAQFVRAERLCERIASQLDLFNTSEVRDIADENVQQDVMQLQNELTDWKAQAPTIARYPTLLFWEYTATLYLHEIVLHTRSNRPSFTAPYLSERLSVTDFPMPIVTPCHVTSIYTVKSAAQDLLDLCTSMPVSILMALPPLLFASRIAYAQYILVKLYIATAAPGNTLGAFLEPESLCVESYLDKLISTAAVIKGIDEQCAMARVLASAVRMKEWLLSFQQSYIGPRNETATFDNLLMSGMSDLESGSSMNWLDLGFDDGVLDLDSSAMFAETSNGQP